MQLNEIKLTYSLKQKPSELPRITSSEDAYNLLFPKWEGVEAYETFQILLLNNQNKVIGKYLHSKGGCTGVIADIKLIFAVALKSLAQGIILAHNHPSGNLVPSEQDKKVTSSMVAAANFFDIKVHDHLILTSEGYMSFADSGIL